MNMVEVGFWRSSALVWVLASELSAGIVAYRLLFLVAPESQFSPKPPTLIFLDSTHLEHDDLRPWTALETHLD